MQEYIFIVIILIVVLISIEYMGLSALFCIVSNIITVPCFLCFFLYILLVHFARIATFFMSDNFG